MVLPAALTALQKGLVLLAFTGVVAPLIGWLLKRVGGGWETMGGGPFAILNESPRKRGARGGAPRVDPAIQAAEVRQLVVVRNERRLRQGLEPLDVEAEVERQLADFIGSP